METEKNTENVWKAEQKNKENVENQAYQISQERALEMLEELLEQDQFELLLPEYKLVYMMNDAVESFLVFHGARMTGIYQDDYEGPLDASVTYENGEIFQHFGHTEQFKLYDIENSQVVRSQIVDTNGQGHGALAGFLTEAGADVLICGGIGSGAQSALATAGIKLYGGVSGAADEAVEAYLAGKLDYNPDVRCSHHEHEHSCAEHKCGEDKHGCAGNEMLS